VTGDVHTVAWVPVPEPDADPEGFASPGLGLPPIQGTGRSGPFLQGEAAGGATIARGEGCWYHRGVVYLVDTGGGAAGKGVVWALRPGRGGRPPTLTALFVSPGEDTADNIDNITVSPRGGIVTCEDGGGKVAGDYRGIEFCGATFSPSGRYLFVNVQLPGVTFAITGPWAAGGL
jgi:secreted PhoX family phosphatase